MRGPIYAPKQMLTMLTTAKAFRGIFEIIQSNALTSWTQLDPRPEVIVFGDDPGVAAICQRLGLTHVPEVATTDQGTPLISDMFLRGQQLASHPVVCWANADIIFGPSLLVAARAVAASSDPIYLVGRRVDLDIEKALAFEPGWWPALESRAKTDGEQKPANWIDYFMFSRGLFDDLPPFAIGRPGYDPWLIWRAAALGARVVDATSTVLAIHQRHDYSHAGGRRAAFTGAEAAANAAIVDNWRHYHSISFARWVLRADGALTPASSLAHRLARPRSYLAHALRFTRPARRRLLGERATWRGRGRRCD